MTLVRFTLLVLFLLILRRISSEQLELILIRKDQNINLGICLKRDYVLVYRSTSDGNLLLGNSSDRGVSDAVAAGLGGRVHITQYHELVMLQITDLKVVDTGVYKVECWMNQTQVSQNMRQLYVCNEVIELEEITMKEGGGAELVCNRHHTHLEGASFRWYYEIYRIVELVLFLDSSVSLEPLVEEPPAVVEVKDRGARLVIKDTTSWADHQFYCLVMNGTDCLSAKHMQYSEEAHPLEMFPSLGDKVALYCPAVSHNQGWRTPLGVISGSSADSDQMYVSPESGNFSLIIPAVSDVHGGLYSCVSLHYLLVLCPKEEYQEQLAHESGNFSVECRLDQDDSLSITWHRRDQSGQEEVLYDSGQNMFTVPADMKDRLTLSEDRSLLTLSDLKLTDGGSYQCIVLSNPGFLEDDEDYEDDSKEGDYYDYDYDYSPDQERCLSKQVTRLIFRNAQPVTISSVQVKTPAAASRSSDNAVPYAVGGGLAGLLVLVAVVVVIVLKKRATVSARQTQAAPNSEALLKAKIELQRDPGGSERLTPHDDVS